MNNALTSVKNFVDRNKVALIVGAVAITGIVIQRKALKQHDEYLKEHGLYEDYYTLEEI